MKKLFSLFTVAMILSLAMPAKAQLVSGPRGYDDFKIGVAGYTYRSYDIDQTLEFLKSTILTNLLKLLNQFTFPYGLLANS